MSWLASKDVLTGILGVVLGLSFLLLWVAYFVAPLRRALERVFVPDRDLFDKQASYAGLVRFLSNITTLLLGILLFMPTRVMFDLSLAAGVILIYWWIVWRSSRAVFDAAK